MIEVLRWSLVVLIASMSLLSVGACFYICYKCWRKLKHKHRVRKVARQVTETHAESFRALRIVELEERIARLKDALRNARYEVSYLNKNNIISQALEDDETTIQRREDSPT